MLSMLRKLVILHVGSNDEESCMCLAECLCMCVCLCLHIQLSPKIPHCPFKSQIYYLLLFLGKIEEFLSKK